MSKRVVELTNDLDRKAGRRRFQIEGLNEDERVLLEFQFEHNASYPDEEKRWRADEHPPANRRMLEDSLALLCALNEKPFALDLTA